ncbi:aldo/keto reductase [Methanimicrococcus blatticola]|uniref:4Fe-4S ferredoxin-type domain-containing protein n=1 Tax=Methanimicrococcus blatticola TaxID=91560 RepID=A0A484F8R6_9EURY|nr:aldo/keto reductase [Methanimicrococcus blatticola]MBZ3935206.1 aldo/keto reductase [Methanimicrococcus blatticola]MCC2508697.1 aldo/keto reductase [Methanimicrococcus blatticola]TDQ71266.1 hypothetical protein C7391_0373 [Methanimicrococcus blatticola]
MKRLGFGLMRLPQKDENDYSNIDMEQTIKMADYFLEKGFTHFDTGYPYHNGNSETAFREGVVKRHPRGAFTISDKLPTWMITSNDDCQKYFDEQLERCGVDYFDLYFLHNLGEKSYEDSLKYGGFDFMRKMKTEGKAKTIGFSYHDKADVLDKILTEQPDMDYVLLQINYADWETETIESRKCYEAATKHGVSVIVMEPLKGGSLVTVPAEVEKLFKDARPEMSVASWAIRFAASLENVVCVLSGMSNMEQMEDNIRYMENFEPLNAEEQEIIAKASEMIKEAFAIPCTACNYCIDDCPKNIPIPKYFSLYNNQDQFGLLPPHFAYYTNLIADHGKASDCISCKKCESHCPQHIRIAEEMEKVTAVFDSQ